MSFILKKDREKKSLLVTRKHSAVSRVGEYSSLSLFYWTEFRIE